MEGSTDSACVRRPKKCQSFALIAFKCKIRVPRVLISLKRCYEKTISFGSFSSGGSCAQEWLTEGEAFGEYHMKNCQQTQRWGAHLPFQIISESRSWEMIEAKINCGVRSKFYELFSNSFVRRVCGMAISCMIQGRNKSTI